MKNVSKPVESAEPESQQVRDSGKPKPAEKPVSLHPLKFEEAVRGLAGVDRRRGKKEGQKK